MRPYPRSGGDRLAAPAAGNRRSSGLARFLHLQTMGGRLGHLATDCQPSLDCRRSAEVRPPPRASAGPPPARRTGGGVCLGDVRRGREGVPRRHARRRRARPRGARRRVHGLRRPVRVRQDDRAEDGGGTRGHHRGRDPHRRHRRQRRDPARARHRDGVPELCPLPAHVRPGQHRLRAQDAEDTEGADRRAREGDRGRPAADGSP
jgi:hypothetical protein